jgi:anti-sigma regulatory factor (Ser/Thr protein kinase)
MTMLTYRASLPRGFNSVRQARRALRAFAETCGFNDTPLADVENAAGEALANAAEHGHGAGSPRFDISATFDGDRLVIEIDDHGRGFDIDAVLARPGPDTAGYRGFGVFLMHTLMDEVAYSERGSRIQLVKRLDDRPLTSSR